MTTPLTMRAYQGDEDSWRIRAFLREVYLVNGRKEDSWQVARWDYWRIFINENIFEMTLADVVYIWEDANGKIAAVVNPDAPNEAFLQIHPAYRTRELETAMMQIAEKHLAGQTDDGKHKLRIWVHADDPLRLALLAERGYVKGTWPETQWEWSAGVPIPDAPAKDGFVIRALGDVDELPARSWVSWRAFHPDEPDEKYEGWEWYHNIQRIPQYRRDLDIVTVAPDKTIVGFCTVWFDDVTRGVLFEPVGVMPEYQGHGLGKAMMCEGLRRAHKLGAIRATVGGYSVEANALYRRVTGGAHRIYERWDKVW